MAEGIMYAWFALTALSVAFVVIDIPKTPESGVLKWAFVILVIFTGPLGAFFYVLGCREPLKGTHAEYVSVRWRQVLGSTMHCAAGDGLGIFAGAVIGAVMHLSPWSDLGLEYLLGFSFGWGYFQAFAMKDMVGGSYTRSLKETFIPELLSMNLLMAGMVPTMRFLMPRIEGANDPTTPAFWFVMSMALIVGFALAYPMNWWLVARNMKHGMLTIGPEGGGHSGHAPEPTPEPAPEHGAGHASVGGHEASGHEASGHEAGGHEAGERPGSGTVLAMSGLSFAIFFAGLWLAGGFFG